MLFYSCAVERLAKACGGAVRGAIDVVARCRATSASRRRWISSALAHFCEAKMTLLLFSAEKSAVRGANGVGGQGQNRTVRYDADTRGVWASEAVVWAAHSRIYRWFAMRTIDKNRCLSLIASQSTAAHRSRSERCCCFSELRRAQFAERTALVARGRIGQFVTMPTRGACGHRKQLFGQRTRAFINSSQSERSIKIAVAIQD